MQETINPEPRDGLVIAPMNTAEQLHSLYRAEGGVAEVFSSKVADYVASRPDYAPPLFARLRQVCTLTSASVVADVGAGTGLFTQGLLDLGCQVVAVEPNAAMRAAADRTLAGRAGYRSVDGKAEAMPLAPSSVNLITAAQAFHWFDIEAARAECLRVLRPRGKIALVWNDRLLTDPLHVALDEVFAMYGGHKRGALLAHEERASVTQFFGGGHSEHWSWPHAQWLDDAGLQSLAFSRSYMPDRASAAGRVASLQISNVFQRFALDTRLAVRYTTVAIVGRPA